MFGESEVYLYEAVKIYKQSQHIFQHAHFSFDPSQGSMRDLISRDSFCATEIEIFRAVCNWAEHNKGQDPTPILDVVRLQVRNVNVIHDYN